MFQMFFLTYKMHVKYKKKLTTEIKRGWTRAYLNIASLYYYCLLTDSELNIYGSVNKESRGFVYCCAFLHSFEQKIYAICAVNTSQGGNLREFLEAKDYS